MDAQREAAPKRINTPRIRAGPGSGQLVLHQSPGSSSAGVRQQVRQYLSRHDIGDAELADVVLCVEEAYANAVRHSGSSAPVDIVVDASAGEVTAVVTDRGKGFDLSAFDPSSTPNELATSGRGLFLMTQLMDELELAVSGGLTVSMRRRCSRDARRERDPVPS